MSSEFVELGLGHFCINDCFETMKEIKDGYVDMILCDLPYGTSACKWDTMLPLKKLWSEYMRLIKIDGAIVLTASMPFTAVLVSSQLDCFKYAWIWSKTKASGFFDVNFRPLKSHEDICVFSKAGAATNSNPPMIYNPQGLVEIKPKRRTSKGLSSTVRTIVEGKGEQTQSNWPKSILEFGSEGKTFHPTQKPVGLFEYLIKTYTDENDLVLDNCAGSGTTAIACENTNRRWICIEKDETYGKAAIERIQTTIKSSLSC